MFGKMDIATANVAPAAPPPMFRRPGGLFGGDMGQTGTARPVKASALPSTGAVAPGAAPRQPFDYKGALLALTNGGQDANRRPGLGTRLLGEGWEGRMSAFGGLLAGDPNAVPNYHAGQQAAAQQRQAAIGQVLDWQRDDHEAQRDADLTAARPFTIGRERLQLDPTSGGVATLYDGAEDFELYAQELGLEPGSPEYFQAVEDYVLRSSGPSAHDRDMSLDDHRTTNDRSLESYRHGNRVGLEGVRQGNRLQLRATPPARAASSRRSSGGGRSSARRNEPTATDAQGRTLVVRNGAWVVAE